MGKTEKLRIPYPVIVEGKYDKIRLANLMEGLIITTDGFGLFRKEEKQQLLRRLAAGSPLIVLTDSDGGGKVIRSRISGMIPKDRLIQLYIPQIKGKERRKNAPSAEGTLGVEGMEDDLLRELLRPYAVGPGKEAAVSPSAHLSTADFFADGLTGKPDSQMRRDELCVRVGLPQGMNAHALLTALSWLVSYDEYAELVGRTPEPETRHRTPDIGHRTPEPETGHRPPDE